MTATSSSSSSVPPPKIKKQQEQEEGVDDLLKEMGFELTPQDSIE